MHSTDTSPQTILHEVFGYGQFRGPQADIVDHVIAGGDALVLMPTGGGKSLCYQVPAIARQRAGRGVQQGDLAAQHALFHGAGLLASLGRVEELGLHPGLMQGADLVVHQ
ncbi:MAG: DEAD/DEAH box helicase, partial [Ramlibacter sp.]